jgi:hypothetical protein
MSDKPFPLPDDVLDAMRKQSDRQRIENLEAEIARITKENEIIINFLRAIAPDKNRIKFLLGNNPPEAE